MFGKIADINELTKNSNFGNESDAMVKCICSPIEDGKIIPMLASMIKLTKTTGVLTDELLSAFYDN